MLRIPGQAGKDLCDKNLGAEDYINIANDSNHIFIEEVPKYNNENSKKAHLEQSKLIHKYASNTCFILFSSIIFLASILFPIILI